MNNKENMNLLLESFLENSVADYLRETAQPGLDIRQLPAGPDFLIIDQDGNRTLLEVKSRLTADQHSLIRLKSLVARGPFAHRFILATQAAPTREQAAKFEAALSSAKQKANWVSINELPEQLGAKASANSPINLEQADDLISFESKAIAAKAESTGGVAAADSSLPYLANQLSPDTIKSLRGDLGNINQHLRLGQRVMEATVVLADIQNFSKLVNASSPERLQLSMSRYYRLVRDSIFRHDGMLDKFIGDGVLAVFGYPASNTHSATHAVQFAQEIIDIGQVVLSEWTGELNSIIPTGIRVGVSTGDIWPINIGNTQLEINFLGDTVNLAARLEKNCDPGNVLIDNVTYVKGSREEGGFITNLKFIEKKLQPEQAKGQREPIRCWTLAKQSTAKPTSTKASKSQPKRSTSAAHELPTATHARRPGDA